jgi:hypothetical protein
MSRKTNHQRLLGLHVTYLRTSWNSGSASARMSFAAARPGSFRDLVTAMARWERTKSCMSILQVHPVNLSEGTRDTVSR